MSRPNIPPPPPRDNKARRGPKKKEGGSALSWVLSLGIGVAAGALSHEWLQPVTDLFNDLLARLF